MIVILAFPGQTLLYAQAVTESPLNSEIVAAAKAKATSVEAELRAKWEMDLPQIVDEPVAVRGQMVVEKQMLFYKALSVEKILKNHIAFPIHIYPEIVYDDNVKSIRVLVETESCDPIHPDIVNSIRETIAAAMDVDTAQIDFMQNCCSVEHGVSWDDFLDLCRISNQILPANPDFGVSNTGSYFGVDGSGSWLDRAAEEYARLKTIKESPVLSRFAVVAPDVEESIRLLLCKGSNQMEVAIEDQERIEQRIRALYSYRELLSRPAEQAIFSFDGEPLICAFRVDSDGIKHAVATYTVSSNFRPRLRNVRIELVEFESIDYRPRGFCVAEEKAKTNGRTLKIEGTWTGLPIGVVDAFYSDVGYCLRAKNGAFSKVFELQPSEDRRYLIKPTGIESFMIDPLPMP